MRLSGPGGEPDVLAQHDEPGGFKSQINWMVLDQNGEAVRVTIDVGKGRVKLLSSISGSRSKSRVYCGCVQLFETRLNFFGRCHLGDLYACVDSYVRRIAFSAAPIGREYKWNAAMR